MTVDFVYEPADRRWITLAACVAATCAAPLFEMSTPALAAYFILTFVAAVAAGYRVRLSGAGRNSGSFRQLRTYILPDALRTDSLISRATYQTILIAVVMTDLGLILGLGWLYFVIASIIGPTVALAITYIAARPADGHSPP